MKLESDSKFETVKVAVILIGMFLLYACHEAIAELILGAF